MELDPLINLFQTINNRTLSTKPKGVRKFIGLVNYNFSMCDRLSHTL